MRRISLLLLALATTQAYAADWPQSRAERTGYTETSHYGDVMDFIRALQGLGAPIRLQIMGKSTQGRDMPLVVASNPPVSSAAEARRLGKPVVYIQANIHAGEVEGKEAAQAILRRACQSAMGLPAPALDSGASFGNILDRVVIVMTPIYNIDGNENFGPMERNRPEQVGPQLVGTRANGQGLDLNRDAMKAESPEMRAVLRYVYNTWDPDIMMDLHTTDGTRHGFDLTYLPPTHPATEPDVYRYGYDTLIPAVQKDLKSRYNFAVFAYGDVMNRNGKPAWLTTGPEGRYCTNYVGLRNRIGILSEAATYIPFKDRVVATDRFVSSVLLYVADHAKQIQDLSRKADAQVVDWGLHPEKAPPLAVRTELATRGDETVPVEHLNPGERPPFGRPKAYDQIKMPIYDRYVATRAARLPAAYLIPPTEAGTIELLKAHGIEVERLVQPWDGAATRYTIKEVNPATTTFQNHHLTGLEGTFVEGMSHADAGWRLVRTAQPLGLLAFQLLEPESIDGVIAWEVLKNLKVGQTYPILKVPTPPAILSDRD